ncbi:hypothetical protein [Sinomonas sp. R1AF57]|uniref:hypothetical protein n=1 Tax=Sinomonas sp. R1AF57 TaxID=2020377 RepID=UPI001ABF897F|nr:hypothetical protein [Sinomonas sp. R1AF57]
MGVEALNGPWTEEETQSLLSAYWSMLDSELRGERYSKIEHNRRVQAETGRSKGSIEFKFCNISHVLWEMGRPYVVGYKPRSHVQESLRVAIQNSLGVRQASQVPADFPPVALEAANALSNSGGTILSDPIAEEESPYTLFSGFWDRATGGTDVAARPDDAVDAVWPVAASAAGVDAALDWFRGESRPADLPRLLFLVGGPGAGKSHASARAVAGLHLVSRHDDGLAHRTYRYSGDSADVLVVNDATIGSYAESSAPLATDIDQMVAVPGVRPMHLMACVNRGILIEELSALTGHPVTENFVDSAGACVIRWLADTPWDESAWTITSETTPRFIRSGLLEHVGREKAEVLAVYVDECSLFEPAPEVEVGRRARVVAVPHSITPLGARSSLPRAASPSHDLIEQVAEMLESTSRGSRMVADPVQANVAMLQQPAVRSSILTLGRSAEMASGLRFTYRELWGLISRVVVGEAPSRMGRTELEEFIALHQPTEGPVENFTRLRKLACLRGTQAMFGAGSGTAEVEAARRDPVLRLTRLIDPVKDAIPGNAPTDPTSGWATPINEAFASHYSESSPLAILRAADRAETFEAIVQPFDESLDDAYVELMGLNSLKQNDRLDAISWYGSYLMRLYAVAHGISAFRREVSVLLDAAYFAPNIPKALSKSLRTLIRPQRQPGGGTDESLLPLFDSRAEPILGWAKSRKLAILMPSLEMKTMPVAADQTVVLLERQGKELGRIALDFALVREALACVDDHAGVTNLVDATSPRLERIRAVHLRSDVLSDTQLRIAEGRESKIVTLITQKGK